MDWEDELDRDPTDDHFDSVRTRAGLWGTTWAMAVDPLGGAALAQATWCWEAASFVLAAHGLCKAGRVVESVLGPTPELSAVRKELDNAFSLVKRARDAVAHFDEWVIGAGKTQPESLLPGWGFLVPRVEHGEVVVEGVEESEHEEGEILRWYTTRDARIPIEPFRELARRFLRAMQETEEARDSGRD